MTTKVLYFPSNTTNNNRGYYSIYTLLKSKFDGLVSIVVDDVDNFLQDYGERFYIKELSYQLEIYNAENEYIFCINKPL